MWYNEDMEECPLNPTDIEIIQLKIHIKGWKETNPMQKAICISFFRGHDTISKIAKLLSRNETEIRDSVLNIWGILEDFSTKKLLFKK